MINIQIKNRWDGSVIYEGKHETFRDAVVSAVANRANLSGADLSDADLSGADLRSADLSGADLRSADLRSADLSRADLSRADLRSADLRSADLSGADLRSADLSGADLSGARLDKTKFDGFPNQDAPASLSEAAQRTKEWLLDDHWAKGKWIETPDGAYAGTCKACLHGAAVYIGGPFGSRLSDALTVAGYGTGWNDAEERTVEEVACALDRIAAGA